MSITRQTGLTLNYGGSAYPSDSATETGDVEIVISETVVAGDTKVFPAAITGANLKILAARSTDLATVITSDAADAILDSFQGVSSWNASSGAANPIATVTVSVTVDNSAGATDAQINVWALQETP